ncbi:MAG: hypothetical protein CMJ76_02200 [Planctomycetaceae bacterium]|nr:hypothetical protein [Planctomycetaceae bacterium]
MFRRSFVGLVFVLLLLGQQFAMAQVGVIDFQIVDSESKEQIPARIHLRDSTGKFVRPPTLPYWHDHFVCNGKVRLRVSPGDYYFEIERGPEYRIHEGKFRMLPGARVSKVIPLKRILDMSQEGWYAGDLHIRRDLKDVPLLMKAEDLYVAPVITWWNQNNLWADRALPEVPLQMVDQKRFMHVLSGEDERDGGALLFHRMPEVFDITAATNHYPSSMQYLIPIRKIPRVHVDIEKPFWWDTPLWIASGMVDSIGLLNNHMQRSKMLPNEAWGKKRDANRFPGVHGNGKWSQELYYQILNTGHRIAPSAGSASGVVDNPVGYNRVYVYCGEDFSWDLWWQNLKQGKVVVTNGPLMRPLVNGKLPGHVFTAEQGQSVTLQATLNLSVQDKVEYLEIVRDGLVIENIPLDEYAKRGGRLPEVEFEESGWLLIRAVTTNPKTYRLACSGPFYVEIDGARRISKTATQFFIDWLKERQQLVQVENLQQRQDVLRYYVAAQKYWEAVLQAANAD